MPLSDNEQRLLEQMERALSAEDPKFASAMRGSSRRSSAGRRLLVGTAGLVTGLVLLVAGVAQQQVVIGVVGFLGMLAGTAYAVSGRRTGPVGTVQAGGGIRTTGRRRRGTFMQRLEMRWDQRRDER